MTGSDAFEIVETSGQLRTKAVLDHESSPSHRVTVTATDPSGARAAKTVTVTVENVDETPVVSGETYFEYEENSAGNLATYSATDPDREGLVWALSGTDSDAFDLSGQTLRFKSDPDFEDPTDSGGNNDYRINGGGVRSKQRRQTECDRPG